MADYLPLLLELAEIEPPLFVFGSVAEAVLLEGRPMESHGDVDVLVPRDELEFQRERLVAAARAVRRLLRTRPGLPLVLGSTRGEHSLELNAVDYDQSGDPYFAVRTDPGLVSIAVPGDIFEWPPTQVGEVTVRTVSPLALIQIRAGIRETEAFGERRRARSPARRV